MLLANIGAVLCCARAAPLLPASGRVLASALTVSLALARRVSPRDATRSCLPRISPVTLVGSSSASRSCMRRLGVVEGALRLRSGGTPQGKFAY